MTKKKRRFEIEYLDKITFTFKIWLSSHHVTEYTFEDDGQILISRRETHRYGKPKYKRGEIKTEAEMWKAFKSEVDDMPLEDQINIPAKFLKLYFWKYPLKPKTKGSWKKLGCVLYYDPE